MNVFCHRPARADDARQAAWLERLRPEFERAQPPKSLHEIYTSFVDDAAMFDLLLAVRPKVVSFHFGLPRQAWIRALREAGIVLFGTATDLDEARALVAAGIHAVVAQGQCSLAVLIYSYSIIRTGAEKNACHPTTRRSGGAP